MQHTNLIITKHQVFPAYKVWDKLKIITLQQANYSNVAGTTEDVKRKGTLVIVNIFCLQIYAYPCKIPNYLVIDKFLVNLFVCLQIKVPQIIYFPFFRELSRSQNRKVQRIGFAIVK